MSSSEYITNSAGTTITGLTLVAETAARLRCYSTLGSDDVRINACRIDCREESNDDESETTATRQGQDIIDDGLVEGRLVGGAWQDICKFTNALQLGAIVAEGYTEFEVRANTPDGIAAFGLCVRATI